MSNTLRIKRRAAGGAAGAPASLANAELAFNEQDNTLYYGFGTGGSGGSATTVIPIAGPGWAAPLASPALTGTPTAPTATANTNSTQLATTAYVLGQANSSAATISMDGSQAAGVSTLWARADHVHPTDTSRAPLASPTFTGTPAAPTAAQNTSTTQLATTAFVLGQASSTTPNALGSAAVGTGTTFARADHVHAMPTLSQLGAPTAAVSFNSQNITNLLDPVNPQDAATKNYVDSVAQGLTVKSPVTCATTANITLSGTQTIDGIAVVAGNRVLVKNQTTAAQNGIYVVAAGAWARATDSSTWTQIVSEFCFVEMGTSQADTGWVCTVDPGGTIGTTSVAFSQFSSAGAYIAGNGLSLAGNTFSVLANGTSINVSGSGIQISSTWAGQTAINTLGTITTGTWTAGVIGAAYGGTGAASLTGYVYGNGTGAMTASTTIPNTAITGLGTMSTQAASAVAITGGSISGLTTFDAITIDGGTF
jgi:hypothetical protein